jgi:toxin ParE1/3/4
VTRTVVFSPRAEAELLSLYDYIAERSGENVALRYIERIESYCLGFDVSGERGTKRDDIRAGLRMVGFERRVAIAFVVDDKTVTILHILYGGRDIEGILSQDG